MTISINVSEEPDNRWNDRLAKSGMGTIYQSMEISTHFKNIGQTPFFLKFIDSKGNIVGQVLIRIYVPNNDFKRKLYYEIFNQNICILFFLGYLHSSFCRAKNSCFRYEVCIK